MKKAVFLVGVAFLASSLLASCGGSGGSSGGGDNSSGGGDNSSGGGDNSSGGGDNSSGGGDNSSGGGDNSSGGGDNSSGGGDNSSGGGDNSSGGDNIPSQLELIGTIESRDDTIRLPSQTVAVESTHENNGVHALKGAQISTPAGSITPHGIYYDGIILVSGDIVDHDPFRVYSYDHFAGVSEVDLMTTPANTDLEFKGVYSELLLSDQTHRSGDATIFVSGSGEYMTVNGPDAIKDMKFYWDAEEEQYEIENEDLYVNGSISTDQKKIGVNYYAELAEDTVEGQAFGVR